MTKVLVATSFPSRVALQRWALRFTHSLTRSLTHCVATAHTPHADDNSLTLNTAEYLLRDIHIHIPVDSHTSLALSSNSAHLRRRYAVHRLHLAVIPCNFLDSTKVVGATSASVTTSPSIFARHAFIHTAPASVARRHRLFAYSRRNPRLARRQSACPSLHRSGSELGWH